MIKRIILPSPDDNTLKLHEIPTSGDDWTRVIINFGQVLFYIYMEDGDDNEDFEIKVTNMPGTNFDVGKINSTEMEYRKLVETISKLKHEDWRQLLINLELFIKQCKITKKPELEILYIEKN